MWDGQHYFVLIGAAVGIVLQIGVLCAVAYCTLKLATNLMSMRREIEELKMNVRQLQHRS